MALVHSADEAGLTRHWFFLLSHAIIDPSLGIFKQSAIDNYSFQASPLPPRFLSSALLRANLRASLL